MKVEIIVKIYNEEGKQIVVGDAVSIQAVNGIYKGTVKKILPKSLALSLEGGSGVQILYNNILKMW